MRDHGGGLDAAVRRWGGARADWLDLSTGINPEPYPVGQIDAAAWTALPDSAAMERLVAAARAFWSVPPEAAVVAAPGASALIARLPALAPRPEPEPEPPVHIPGPTYNEHEAAFRAAGCPLVGPEAPVHVVVHPNNPDGRLWPRQAIGGRPLTIVDESFADILPSESHVPATTEPGVIVLKSFGKFWGLAGLRLGFVIARPTTLDPPGRPGLADLLGPWPVSGPALAVGAPALEDLGWARAARARLARDADRLDALMRKAGAGVAGGTTLFRLYEVDDAAAWQARLAKGRVWSRTFPYSRTWLRLGLPGPDRWEMLERALRS